MNPPSTERKSILYFGNDWNADNRTSSHHIARRLAAHHDVYYFECPGMRTPRSSGRDLRRVLQKLGRALRGSRNVMPGLRVQTLLQIPLHRFRAIRWLNQRLLYWTVRWLLWRQKIVKPITWFVAPHVSSLLGQFDESLSVYYCIDDYASLPMVDRRAVSEMDDRLTRDADIVFVCSETLLEAKRERNPRTFYSPHGVDVELFGHARSDNSSLLDDLKGIKKPIIGFFGLVEAWVDLELIRFLAEQRPNWTFLMIGRVAVPIDAVAHLPNVLFIGPRPYESLPHYGSQFAASILPFKLTPEAWHANPLKLLEYLAMGSPVVSVAIPAAEKLADVIGIARDRNEFLALLDGAVHEHKDSTAVQARMVRAAGSSWDARVAEVLTIVGAFLQSRPCPSASSTGVGDT